MTREPIDYDKLTTLYGPKTAMVMHIVAEDLNGISQGLSPIATVLRKKKKDCRYQTIASSTSLLVRRGYMQRERIGNLRIYSVAGYYTQEEMRKARTITSSSKHPLPERIAGPHDVNGVHMCCVHKGCIYIDQCCQCKQPMMGRQR